ncbi:hypothetical protein SADUNF_Sadunf19G0058700 [Salix dunnii]|uniref:Uncharacterized protein n=1 Tax=Salix dunnii TaxID=1413687 RepID=A0A835J0P9_9ROSI|nr:hypothetical protein SADUNF_Sadunf19G0058700 [Salix dunnii]
MCKNYILNILDNTQYNVQINQECKDIFKCFGKYVQDFKMFDSRIIISEVQELQLILHDTFHGVHNITR